MTAPSGRNGGERDGRMAVAIRIVECAAVLEPGLWLWMVYDTVHVQYYRFGETMGGVNSSAGAKSGIGPVVLFILFQELA